MGRQAFDAVVVGAGIAGLAVAAELSELGRVALLEAEPTIASQASARSATSWIAGYSGPAVTPFTLASRAWYESGGGYADRSLLTRRGLLLVSSDPLSRGLAVARAAGASSVDLPSARALFPALREGVIQGACHDPDTHDIDAAAAVEALRLWLEANGGAIHVDARVTALRRDGGSWQVATAQGDFLAGLVVNAAGAWADEVAALAGVPPIGARAYRRTACLFDAAAGVDVRGWPLLMDADEGYYVKPFSHRFVASPADETLQAPGPTVPQAGDVADALGHVRRVTTLEPDLIVAEWAGLRTFVADRAPVLGPDPAAAGFAWYAAVGGYGIMTAPAAARSVVSLVEHGRLPADVAALGIVPGAVLPDRLEGRA